MIRLSNLRLEHDVPFEYGKSQSRIICDLEADFTDVKSFWFSVDTEFGCWLTADVYDSFLVAMLYPAMYYGEDIDICGNVSKKIWHNINYYVQGLMKTYDPSFCDVFVTVQGFADAAKVDHLHIGTGFSGGIDSFSTLTDNFFNTKDSDYKIDTLFFFHVGQYGNVKERNTWLRASNRFGITKEFAKEIGVGAIMMNTNLFDFYLPKWEYDAGVLCRITSVLVFQKMLKRYYISNAVTYRELAKLDFTTHHVDMAEISDPIIMPLLSPNGLDILCDGAQYSRTEKTARIVDLALAQKYLNVCVNSSNKHVEAKNCSRCSKCLRTMMALESAGALQKFSGVFDLKQWKRRSFKYKCKQVFLYKSDSFAQDNVDFARKQGERLPDKLTAAVVVSCLRLIALPRNFFRKLKKKGHG